MGILYGSGELTTYQALAQAFSNVSGFSFLTFNLLCAPCFAAMGAIRHEMNNTKWFWFAIGWQCGFAYLVSLLVNQIGGAFTGSPNVIGLAASAAVIVVAVYMLFFKKYSEATKLTASVGK